MYKLLLLSLFILITGCVNNPTNPTLSKLEKVISEYKGYKDYHKAMAIALDENGRYAYGRSWNYPLISQAKQRAILECNKAKARYQVESDCKIYMIDNDVIRKLEEL